ncbi:hypothetical protein ACLOJK_005186, partial [Asimina triloba]
MDLPIFHSPAVGRGRLHGEDGAPDFGAPVMYLQLSLSPNPAFDVGVPEASNRGDAGANASRTEIFMSRLEGSSGKGGTPMRCWILASIFREASSCPSNEEIFCRPFDMEARAIKILGDLLPVESRGVRKNYALGLLSTLDVEGRGLGEQMLKKFLPDVWRELLELEERIRLVDGYSSREEYRYHILGQYSRFPVDCPRTLDRFETSGQMEEKEHRNIIDAVKRPKEVAMKQVPREVPRPDTPIHSEHKLEEEWKLMEEAGARARSVAWRRIEVEREKCRAEGMTEGSRHFFLLLMEMGRRAHRAEAWREEAEKAAVSLRSALDAERADLEVARDDVDGILLLKRDLDGALASVEAKEEISRLLSEIDILRAERDEAIRKAASADDR